MVDPKEVVLAFASGEAKIKANDQLGAQIKELLEFKSRVNKFLNLD